MIDKSLLAVVIASREAMHEKAVKECRDRYLCSTCAEMAGRSFMFYPLVIFSLVFCISMSLCWIERPGRLL